MLKEDTAKVELGSYILENAGVLYPSKNINKVRLKYGRDLILFKKQKESAAGVLIDLKYLIKVRLGSYIVEIAKMR